MTSHPPRIDIAVLVKAPIAGFAKTRLISALGPAGAARLHRRLAARTVVTAVSAALGEVTIWAAPDAAHRFFRALSRSHGVRGRPQPSGDLGRRMLAAFVHEQQGIPLLVIGTDCPPLMASHLHAAADALRAGHDATFLAAEDGGYVLIGLRRAIPELFGDIAWGTDRVMAQTRGRMRELGLKWHEGEVLWDVDRPEDLHRLAALEYRAAIRARVGRSAGTDNKLRHRAFLTPQQTDPRVQTSEQPILRDIVLIGGGHSHVGVLRRFAMKPLAGVRLNLICSDSHTPYSGMLPGYIAGHYGFDAVHIDLDRLCVFAGARMFRAEAIGIGIDRSARCVQCRDRPPIAYDLLSINIGSTPQMAQVPGADEFAVPVKPIRQFNERWLALLERVRRHAGRSTIAVAAAVPAASN